MQPLERLDLILNERVLTELTTAAGIADEFWVVVMETQPRGLKRLHVLQGLLMAVQSCDLEFVLRLLWIISIGPFLFLFLKFYQKSIDFLKKQNDMLNWSECRGGASS